MRLPRRTSVLATAAVGLAIIGAWLLLTPKSPASQPAQPAPVAATSNPATPPRETQPVSSPQPSSDQTAADTTAGEPPAQAGQAEVADALQVSADFVADWLSPGAADWWPSLEERMTPSAAQAYEVDPEEVPSGHRVSADPVVLGDASQVLCRAEVSTTRGDYRVTLAREHAEDPWLVDRIIPPDQ